MIIPVTLPSVIPTILPTFFLSALEEPLPMDATKKLNKVMLARKKYIYQDTINVKLVVGQM